MPPKKRKRSLAKDYECFPDEVHLGSKKQDTGPSVSTSSVSSAWLRCGDGFAGTSTQRASGSSERTSAILHIEAFSPSRENCKNDIVWSSSDSDQSDDESEPLVLRLQRSPPTIDLPYNKHYHLSEEKSSGDEEQQFIDWEKDSEPENDDENEEWSQSEKAESTVQICDLDSPPSSISLNAMEQETGRSEVIPTDISEYSSDNDKVEDEEQVEVPASRLGCVQKQMLIYGTDQRQTARTSASDWLKSAQTLLQTPERRADKSIKTPEDSAKKRKRFLRGGLAETLNRLQNRERSAISFWRHQGFADHKTPSGNRSGVLIVKILQLHEECSVQVAGCKQLGILPVDSSSEDSPPDHKLTVLFSKETAAHLKATPNNIVHIYPPWHKLNLHNENFPVVMNTYFSQKVFSDDKEEMKGRTPCPEKLPIKRKIVSLSRIFKLTDAERPSQVACPNVITPKTVVAPATPGKQHPSSHTVTDSLLEVVETQGAVGWRSIHVRVVVQRIYCLPARDGSGCQLQGSAAVVSPSVSNSSPSNIRLCLLVQDVYGIFSELQLYSQLSSAEDLELHRKNWEGKSCCLTGMKILQRTTRGRSPGLFNLIDSLWPPLVPLKIHGQSQDKVVMKPSLPPPSFCYILAAHPDQGSVDFSEDSEMSDLYLPPAVHSLRQMIQVVSCSHRCSFCANVVYRRHQAKNSVLPGQCEFWLFVTDRDLQRANSADLQKAPRVLPVGVLPSCVVSAAVTEALAGASSCVVFFKDAVRESGRILCVERTVLSLQEPPLCAAIAADPRDLAGPVELEELDSATQPHALCRLRGAIVGVNEATALSWPACNRCDNEKLEQCHQDRSSLYCRRCAEAVTSPILKMQLEVFLECPSIRQGTVKVKLQQNTISSLLGSAASEDGSYELTSVLGKEVGPLDCYLLSAASHPPACTVLEEVCLRGAGGNAARD